MNSLKYKPFPLPMHFPVHMQWWSNPILINLNTFNANVAIAAVICVHVLLLNGIACPAVNPSNIKFPLRVVDDTVERGLVLGGKSFGRKSGIGQGSERVADDLQNVEGDSNGGEEKGDFGDHEVESAESEGKRDDVENEEERP
eukprot:TRINITY_DN7950_c0_g5_i2.p2 TRINITY_DN7950_c0_g5~~TRINITY_DN7950_c0_g5_i2.p2  ORF type:complete len:143 (-),score=14.12 TRINITY_DN7950_c0_g5_i2:355-783(-)